MAVQKFELQITGCTDSQMWYADKVGQCVPLVREEKDCYISREPDGYTNIVKKEDSIILPVGRRA